MAPVHASRRCDRLRLKPGGHQPAVPRSSGPSGACGPRSADRLHVRLGAPVVALHAEVLLLVGTSDRKAELRFDSGAAVRIVADCARDPDMIRGRRRPTRDTRYARPTRAARPGRCGTGCTPRFARSRRSPPLGMACFDSTTLRRTGGAFRLALGAVVHGRVHGRRRARPAAGARPDSHVVGPGPWQLSHWTS